MQYTPDKWACATHITKSQSMWYPQYKLQSFSCCFHMLFFPGWSWQYVMLSITNNSHNWTEPKNLGTTCASIYHIWNASAKWGAQSLPDVMSLRITDTLVGCLLCGLVNEKTSPLLDSPWLGHHPWYVWLQVRFSCICNHALCTTTKAWNHVHKWSLCPTMSRIGDHYPCFLHPFPNPKFSSVYKHFELLLVLSRIS